MGRYGEIWGDIGGLRLDEQLRRHGELGGGRVRLHRRLHAQAVRVRVRVSLGLGLRLGLRLGLGLRLRLRLGLGLGS